MKNTIKIVGIIITAQKTAYTSAPLPASFIAKVERFFRSHMPPQFELELQCTQEEQPPPKRRCVCMCPEGAPLDCDKCIALATCTMNL